MRFAELYTKSQLFATLGSKDGKIVLNGRNYILNSIERESSDGCSFNLTVRCARTNERHSFFVRTID